MRELATAWWDWTSAAAWQVALLAAVVAVLDRALARRGAPRLRHVLWLLVLVKFALPPTLASPVSVAAVLQGTSDASASSPDAAVASVPDVASPWIVAAFGIWVAGAALLGALAVVRTLRLRRALVAGSVPTPDALRDAFRRAAATMAVRRVPRLVVSRAATGIALIGVLRPLLVVPARTLPRREAEHAFLHEMAHLRRRDLLVAVAATAVRCAFWWHPAAWIAVARLADLREICSDADVAEVLGDRSPAYRATLTAAVRRLVGAPSPAAVAWLGGRTGLVARLEALSAAPRRRSALQRATATAAVLVAAACGLPMAAPVPEPDEVALARRFLADAATGRTRASCYQTKYAALRIAAAQASQEGTDR